LWKRRIHKNVNIASSFARLAVASIQQIFGDLDRNGFTAARNPQRSIRNLCILWSLNFHSFVGVIWPQAPNDATRNLFSYQMGVNILETEVFKFTFFKIDISKHVCVFCWNLCIMRSVIGEHLWIIITDSAGIVAKGRQRTSYGEWSFVFLTFA